MSIATRVTLTPKNEKEWLSWRKQDLTSTEVSALFGVNPYHTAFELHHLKAGTLEDSFKANERTVWGNRLEAAIAAGVAEDYGVKIEPFKTYGRMTELRLGASFDFKIVGLVDEFEGNQHLRYMFEMHGPGILEIKNVDGLQFKRKWIEDSEGVEAPPHIEFQMQQQMLVSGLGWAAGAALVGGNSPVVFTRTADVEAGKAIIAKAAEFWARIDAKTPPAPEFTKDGATIAKLFVDNDGTTVDMSDDPRVFVLCKTYKDAGAEEKAAKERKDAAKAELLTIIKSAKTVQALNFKISAGTNKESYRVYTRAGFEKATITISQVPEANIEATVAPFRAVRISEAA